MIFLYRDTCGISKKKIIDCWGNLVPEINRIKHLFHQQYATEYASLYCPFDYKAKEQIDIVVSKKKALNPTILIIVGIGGSSLGAKAIQEAIFGRLYHTTNPPIKIYFAQTVDTSRMHTIVQVVKRELEQKHTVIINVITKSGTTTETIVNFQILLDLLKQYHPDDYAQYVVVTTDEGSVLWNIALQEQFDLLPIPKKVGGRYSVFSSVGQFPLALLDIDVKQLLKGAQRGVELCLHDDIQNNPAALSALIMYHHYREEININDLFIFSLDLESLGKWYRQLMAESIGKEHDVHGNRIEVGITPTVSMGSIDLHSVAQLYLGGPRDKFTTFVTIEKESCEMTIPKSSLFANQFPQFVDKSLSSIMNAIAQGTKRAYQNNERHFCSVVLEERNEYNIGLFMQFKMLEIMYLGFLLEVNPFDQPNVELYKRETNSILGL